MANIARGEAECYSIIISKLSSRAVYFHAQQKHLGCKKGRGQEEPATKSPDIN